MASPVTDDWTGWTCYVPGQPVYTVIFDEEKKHVRHYACHTDTDILLREMNESVKRMEQALDRIKRIL